MIALAASEVVFQPRGFYNMVKCSIIFLLFGVEIVVFLKRVTIRFELEAA